MSDVNQGDGNGAATEYDPKANPLHGDVSGEREVAIREREAEILALRASFVSQREIAERYKISESRVSRIISGALHRTVAKPAAHLRQESLLQVERLLRANARTAYGLPRDTGDAKPTLTEQARATDVCARLMEKRDRLLGLDKVTVDLGLPPEERAAKLAESLEAYLAGREDAQAEAEPAQAPE